MLEHHPLTWHSKFIQLMLAGLLFWGISYICGYLLTDLDVIKFQSIHRYYTRSNFVSFHVIYCLSVICLWAIYFYKNNAIKSFYPLQRFYLTRLFLQLFVAFALLVSADVPFTAGVFAKARTILPEEQMEKDIDKINLGGAFLVEDKENYSFIYNEKYNKLGYNFLKYNNKQWENSQEYYYYPELLDSKYIRRTLPYRSFVPENDSLVTTIDSTRYLFFSTVRKYDGPDSCISYDLVGDLHQLDNLHLHRYAIENYASLDFEFLHPQNTERFGKVQIPRIHSWAANNQKDSIAKAIHGLMDVAKKYNIPMDLNPELFATYLEAKQYHHTEGVIDHYANDNARMSFASHFPAEYDQILKYSNGGTVDTSDLGTFIFAMERQAFFFFAEDQFDGIVSSYRHAYTDNVFDDFYGILFLAFFMAWLFIFFEFANIVSLLISIPIGGVLAIIIAILLVYVNAMMAIGYVNADSDYDYHSAERISIIIPFIVCVSILGVTLFGLYSKRFSKKVLSVLINLSFIIVPGFITLVMGMINLFSGHKEYGRCSQSSYEYSFTYLLDPWCILLYAFIGVISFFPAVIKWRAKPE